MFYDCFLHKNNPIPNIFTNISTCDLELLSDSFNAQWTVNK